MDIQKALRLFKYADPKELARFIEKVEFTDDCWLWTAHIDKGGYSKFQVKRDGKFLPRMGHQLAYEWTRGKDAPRRHSGWHLDHRCDTRHCVNPRHIRKVRLLKNVTEYATNGNARKDHCANGHPYDKENTYIIPGTRHRGCRECRRENVRRYRARKKETI